MRRLLFTGGGGAGNELVYRLWQDRYDCHFADSDPDAFSPMIPPERRHVIPRAADPDFCHRVAEIAGRDGLIIPGVDEELPVLERMRRDGHEILMPDFHYITVMLDKMGSMAWLQSLGVHVPHTTVMKPRWGRGSRDVFVEQERLYGQEYTVQVCAGRDKKLRAIVPARVDLKRGITIRAALETQASVIDSCRQIHAAIPTCGTYNVQGMLTEDRGFLPFEINPRISTTTCLAIAAGVDPVAIWYGEQFWPEWKAGTTLRRTWHNEVP